MKYRLIEAVRVPMTLRMFPQTKNGRVTYTHYQRLEPGKTYYTDDPAQKAYLRDHIEKVRYNEELLRQLEACGAEYEIVRCRSCGGRVKKIEYRNIEVLEDE